MELKPCPFCGGPVEIEKATETYSRMYGNREYWGVVCRNTINLGGSCAIQQIPSVSKEAAVERWNRRSGYRNAVLEEAAEECIALRDEDFKGTEFYSRAADLCVAAIRALKTKEGK
jgi:hypothetical protein